MAQSITLHYPGSHGNASKFQIAVAELVNTVAETTYTLTPAAVGMKAFLAIIPVDQVATAAVRVTPTRVNGLITTADLVFTGGSEITLLLIGV